MRADVVSAQEALLTVGELARISRFLPAFQFAVPFEAVRVGVDPAAAAYVAAAPSAARPSWQGKTYSLSHQSFYQYHH